MSAIPSVAAVGAALSQTLATSAPAASANPSISFASLLEQGIKTMETKVATADELVQRFAVGDDIPVHQVTFALEGARLSVELAMQVRSRLVEAYRDLMNMQL